ncbi:hypothetical protein SY88_23765 [Clostridiales bacterium PH28_bin88]|nr:hypothetical protein SY88_23765 [Clostridiales bacterium PH28_bin88]
MPAELLKPVDGVQVALDGGAVDAIEDIGYLLVTVLLEPTISSCLGEGSDAGGFDQGDGVLDDWG